ncbi:MAG TPA: hemerythrin domain-containing protein, partial [Jatrophihabitans sp.]|nr:hemerythrin domain-containing protein [Jatrophihabitans sp.]
GGRIPVATNVDLTMMYVAHNAFIRDLHRLTEACVDNRAFTPATVAGWRGFVEQLHLHHRAEDASLWPRLRAQPLRWDEVAVLDAMELEHAGLEVLLERAENAFADCRADALDTALRALTEALTGHLRHEEDEALPLVAAHLDARDWDDFVDEARRLQGGVGGAAKYLPWLLDGATDDTRARVLRLLPPPVRMLYRRVWAPRYRRSSWWQARPGGAAQPGVGGPRISMP